MPFITPCISNEVLHAIQTAEEMRGSIQVSVPENPLMDTDEKLLVAGIFSLVMEHHGAILHLLKTGQFDGSAFALVRPLIEGAYRAHWIYACAEPDKVLRIKNGENGYPKSLIHIAKEVEKKTEAGGFFASIAPYTQALHGYTHGGLEQLGRRFNSAGDLTPDYSDAEKIEIVRVTTAHTMALAIAWCHLTSTNTTNTEPRSKAISDRYLTLYS
jgi:hypothetical protein